MKSYVTLAATLAAFAASGASLAASPEDIIAKEKCSTCHTATTTKKAPSFAAIAGKYKGNADAANKIAAELKSGGKVGDEEDHKKVAASDADLKALATYILGAK